MLQLKIRELCDFLLPALRPTSWKKDTWWDNIWYVHKQTGFKVIFII